MRTMSDEYPENGIAGSIAELKWNFTTINVKNKRYLPTTQKLNRKRIKGYESAKDKFNGNKYSPWYKRFEVGRYYKLEHHAASESVPEMVPQLVVPDLTDCDLKPYVSYRTTDIYQEPFTSQDLFNIVYGKKILSDYKEGKLDGKGQPLEPSPEESMTADEAEIKARQTGSDIFEGGVERSKLWNIRFKDPNNDRNQWHARE